MRSPRGERVGDEELKSEGCSATSLESAGSIRRLATNMGYRSRAGVSGGAEGHTMLSEDVDGGDNG